MQDMTDPAARAAFVAALMEADPGAHPPGLSGEAARRFRVYRNNVHMGLQDALMSAYPTVVELVGEPFFRAMAAAFIRSETERPRSLAMYGEGFAEFIAGFAPASALVYLADIARLERARLESLHAPDAAALDPSGLPGSGEVLIGARLVAHPATRIVRARYPVVSIWRVHQPGADVAGRAEIGMRPEAALVCRPQREIFMIDVTPSEAAFADALLSGAPIGMAYEQAVASDGPLEVMSAFSRLLQAGAFTAIKPSSIGEGM